ncbi:MAG TPA: YceI family protein [Solirubrobacteraceae bacterium]|nr:YceI family protein [Solirubrobacteraceae bacterium]
MHATPPSLVLGPEQASLTVLTGRTGPAAAMGHDLEISVERWRAEIGTGADGALTALALEADADSLRVISGSGGAKPLSAGDKAKIEATVRTKILRGTAIRFRATEIAAAGAERLDVTGELSLGERQGPVTVALCWEASGRFSGAATVHQSAFGIEPYSALLGALRLRDEVTVRVEGRLGR